MSERGGSGAIHRRRWVVGTVLVLVVSASLGWWLTASAEGPLRQGAGGASVCFPRHGADHVILGDEILINSGDDPVTIDSVTLTGTVNLRQTAAFVTPLPTRGPTLLMGEVTGTPWAFSLPELRTAWRARQPAAGAVVAPSSDGSNLNLLVVARVPRGDEPAAATGVEVRYRGSLRSHVWHGSVRYRAIPGRSC